MTKRILVVDDEPDLLQIVSSILETKGYEIDVAHDGREALDKITASKPDLLIIDLMMPVLSGLEVVRRLKRDEETQDLPIIVMSATVQQSGKSEEFFRVGLGSDDFIMKPFDPLALLGRVEAVLRMRAYETHDHSSRDDVPKLPKREGPRSTAKKGGVTLEEMPTLDPAEIVKAFIEAWNFQDFAVEYHCLSEAMTGSLPLKSYLLRRQQAFADDMEAQRNQRVLRVVEMSGDEATARVVVEREDTVRGHARRRMEEYELVRGDTNWQIKTVRPHHG
ncbi:response regulator [Candidatus Sumerlaeota bacterium]|nr:response regulator [Candidatus Sumerlaeota bacterium]